MGAAFSFACQPAKAVYRKSAPPPLILSLSKDVDPDAAPASSFDKLRMSGS
jgi:hypothetical protein